MRNDQLFQSQLFRDYWQRLSQVTNYHINIDTPTLIEECLARLNNMRFPEPKILVERGAFVQTRFTIELKAVMGNRARLRIAWENTAGSSADRTEYFKARDDLAKALKEPRLRGFKLSEVIDAGLDSRVIFANDIELYVNRPHTYDTQEGQRPQERVNLAPIQTYPVFNLIDRTARETELTRPTINRIFQGLRDTHKQSFLRNPEGFAGQFITTIRNTLADHIVERIEFIVGHSPAGHTLDDLFPPRVTFPQKELINASDNGLYNDVQIDSEVEERFVRHRLADDDHVIAFFKFPAKFKIRFPKIIGNYNPDWGVLRRDHTGQVTLELVRETKGSADPTRLQFPSERRKIRAAERHFQAIGVDYRVVTDQTPDWYQPEPIQGRWLPPHPQPNPVQHPKTQKPKINHDQPTHPPPHHTSGATTPLSPGSPPTTYPQTPL